jgi:hypothetical protein
MTPHTIASAGQYWEKYYNSEFIFGLGTERILAVLCQVPPVMTWTDLGSGSESLLWSIPLDAQRLISVDLDPRRLNLLSSYAAARKPRTAYQTALDLCGRTRCDFTRRCNQVSATVVADCLTDAPLPLRAGCATLVTQFGLLGLSRAPDEFLASWAACHELLAAGGWAAGANWNATSQPGRVRLSRQLYTQAFALAGMTPLLIERVPITADPDFDSLWIYLGRRT